jgi:drug/metabolite transporter (DMT)-like permease
MVASSSRSGTAQSGQARSGLALAVLSAATFGTSGIFASSLIDAGWSPAAAVLSRAVFSALVLTIPAVAQLRGRWELLRRGAARAIAFGVVAVAGCQLCYFNAIARMPVGVALLLEYLGAVLVVGWLWLRHGQRPRRLTLAGAVTAITGLVLVLNLTGSARISGAGVMWGLLAAAGLAAYFVLSAATGEDQLPPVVMAWAGMTVGAAVLTGLGLIGALPVITTTADVSLLGHQVSWIVPVAGLSLVAAVVAYVAGIGAARRLGPKLASFIGMAEVLFAILFAWLLLGQLPAAVQFLGGAFILAGVTLVRIDELRPASYSSDGSSCPPGIPASSTERNASPCPATLSSTVRIVNPSGRSAGSSSSSQVIGAETGAPGAARGL